MIGDLRSNKNKALRPGLIGGSTDISLEEQGLLL